MKHYYYQRVKQAVRFIEDNLKHELSVDLIAEQACFSKYYFIRVFMAVTGDTVGEYVRKRRITRSAEDLISTDKSILAIAMDYQFESQEAFTRSFKSVYRITPAKYRKRGFHQLAYRKNELSDSKIEHLNKYITREPQIVETTPKKLVGVFTSTSSSQAHNNIRKLWLSFIPRIREIRHVKDIGMYGVHPYDSESKVEDFSEQFTFQKWAAVEVNHYEDIPAGLACYDLPAGKYARFTHKGGIRDFHISMDYVYGTWLAASDFELDLRDDFEHYGERFYGPENPASEIDMFIPIK
ncbi:AraC family transcriptional regulator [Fulvivirga kasyanovii]|uniref:Helix-turn-helix domain-containing protein n=1 Tax=Fulvivirga kasyanovii TaxID=396812 RepID=A0ABW9RP31_9BACT|nr:helix-turn-helix domain-containing protein [Fulvivirga kasyanovii]MTI25686.1 helix-turn-helix domain-containing protein [Fulvivirga kasyanovii]